MPSFRSHQHAHTVAPPSHLWMRKILLLALAGGCASVPKPSDVPYGPPGSLVVSVTDTAGKPRYAVNTYFAEDKRVTSEVVMWSNAGVWRDSLGFARMGAWRPGAYTLVIRSLGFEKQQHAHLIRAGVTDTLRIVIRVAKIPYGY